MFLRILLVVIYTSYGSQDRCVSRRLPSQEKTSIWFDSTSSRRVETLGKSFTRNCLYDVIRRLVANLDSCDRPLSSVHTLLVNILRCVILYIKRTYKKYG